MEFFIVFFYLTVKRKIGMMVALFFIHFLREKGDYVDIRFLLNFHNKIVYFFAFCWFN